MCVYMSCCECYVMFISNMNQKKNLKFYVNVFCYFKIAAISPFKLRLSNAIKLINTFDL